MKQLLFGYLRTALYNIRQNKAYATFCILGTALVTIFIIAILQLSQNVAGNLPPQSKADRTIWLNGRLEDTRGKYAGIAGDAGARQFADLLRGYEAFAISNKEEITTSLNGTVAQFPVIFANSAFWEVNDLQFLSGKAFSSADNTDQQPVAVISKDIADNYFKNHEPLGSTFDIQHITYRIIGITESFSGVSVPDEINGMIWVPAKFNKFFPSMNSCYTMQILYPEAAQMHTVKNNISGAISRYFTLQNRDVTVQNQEISTTKEIKMQKFGGNFMTYGVGIVIAMLLIVPAINIIALGMTNTANIQQELAIRRAIGATKKSIALQIMTETYLLVITGALIGILLIAPVTYLLNALLLQITDLEGTVFTGVDPLVLLYFIPLIVLFGLLLGGFPAYKISKDKIAEALKGGRTK